MDWEIIVLCIFIVIVLSLYSRLSRISLIYDASIDTRVAVTMRFLSINVYFNYKSRVNEKRRL
jgi:hypothetical protein